MSVIDNARAALGSYESWDGDMPHIEELEGQIARDHADSLATHLRDLIAEHERLTAMHAEAFRIGVKHQETIERLNADAVWEYGIRATGDDEPYTEITEDLDWLLDAGIAEEHQETVRRVKAGPWELLPIHKLTEHTDGGL